MADSGSAWGRVRQGRGVAPRGGSDVSGARCTLAGRALTGSSEGVMWMRASTARSREGVHVGCPLQLRDDRGRLGVVSAGNAVVHLSGIVSPLRTDPVDLDALLQHRVPDGVAIDPAGLHHKRDFGGVLRQVADEAHEELLLVGLLPPHGDQGVRSGSMTAAN